MLARRVLSLRSICARRSSAAVFSEFVVSKEARGGMNLSCHALSKNALFLKRIPPVRFFSQNEQENSASVAERIEKMVKSNKVVVFMKGVPDQPMCGFSNAVVQVLRMHGVENYDSHNVLEDDGLRQGIKDFSDWPTIPQVYFNGEFIGGCDILLQMHQSGDLIEELEKLGIKSALVK